MDEIAAAASDDAHISDQHTILDNTAASKPPLATRSAGQVS